MGTNIKTLPRTLRILNIDSFPWHFPSASALSEHGVRLEVAEVGETKPGQHPSDSEAYKASPDICQQIGLLTDAHNYDVVIVGNNLGAGVEKARSIHPRLKSRTVIVWNEYKPGEEAPYVALGVTRFMSRVDLKQYILNLVAG